MPEQIDYELATEFVRSVDKTKQRRRKVLETVAVVLIVAAVAAVSITCVIDFLEKKNAKHALKMTNEIIEAEVKMFNAQGVYAPRVKSLGLFLPENKTPFENPKCAHSACLFSGKFSYAIDNGNVVTYREGCPKEKSQYYFKAKMNGSSPVYCYGATEKAALLCESLGAEFYPHSDPIKAHFDTITDDKVQIFVFPKD
ncbi:hypothetical protein Dip510_001976 [Elusimicrobium posterum]|uniref:hypothetical protein n=1 Tax=Elusimicrobium posterum TaxID=3116653 RepID=UPI003C76570A